MIYVVYGLSGPLKRVLIDPIVRASQDNIRKITINKRGVFGKNRKLYDKEGVELILCRKEEELSQKCGDKYIYPYCGYRMAINEYEIEASLKNDENHIIICHKPDIIKKLQENYPGTQVIKISFTSTSNNVNVLELACREYDDNFPERAKKVANIITEIENEGKIRYNIEIIENIYADNYEEIGQYLYKDLLKKINSKWFCLLNPNRTNNQENKQNGFLAFEQDYNRVINSAAFRRLQDKAQVFPLEKNDYPRTRLTHSIECSAIAEELGIRVVELIKGRSDFIESCYKIPTILKTAALLHDMGNPPFGHFGEYIIQHWFKKQFEIIEKQSNGEAKTYNHLHEQLKKILDNNKYKNDFIHFDGNAQLFRLVTSLDYVNDTHRLDLTYATLAVILKYPTNSENISKGNKKLLNKKPGYFTSEEKNFEKVQRNVGIDKGKRHPLTFLLEAADDISYLTSDLQDAHHKKLISWQSIIDEKDGFGNISEIMKYIEKIKSSTDDKNRDEKILFEKFHVFLREILIDDAINVFKENFDGIMEGTFEDELIKVSKSQDVEKVIRGLLETYVYLDDTICRSEIMANTILTKLLDVFISATLEYNSDSEKQKDTEGHQKNEISELNKRVMHLLSDNYKEVCKKIIESEEMKEPEKIYHKILLATDYICGMTDSYAQQMYNMIAALPSNN